ncbi:conserved hypothetical protein [Desulfovibrionales bacterium]
MNGHPPQTSTSHCPGGVNSKAETLGLHDPQRLEYVLREENECLGNCIKTLKSELALDATTVEAENNDLSLDKRERLFFLNVETMKAKKSTLLDTINDLRLRYKAIQEDEHSSDLLQGMLTAELDDCTYKREVILRKFKDLKDGIRRMEYHKKCVVPFSRQQDDLLRRACLLLKETQDRMELSVVLKQFAAIASNNEG